jgi:pimeloyl-ACP methyl ester carboxylesterase
MTSAPDGGHISMATFVLIPGAGSDAWHWHLVVPRLQAVGHDVIAVDLPSGDDAAGIPEYADVVVEAIGTRRDVVLVAQSMGAFTASVVAHRVPTRLIVLVAAMVPAEGESPGDWWSNTRHDEAFREAAARDGRDPDDWDPTRTFLHDVPADVAAESAQHVHEQSDTPFRRSFPMPPWPDVPTRFVLCRDDRFFPAEFQRRVVAERLGIAPDELDGGHLPALARPGELAERLLDYVGAS